MKRWHGWTGMVAFGLVLAACATIDHYTGGRTRFYKGNTHTHTLWSDGTAAPELVADWYQRNGYQFLVLSDHNVMADGKRWFPISAEGEGRLTPARVRELQERFGTENVELRDGPEGREMRLMNLAELRRRFELSDFFLLVSGEEVTDSFDGKPVHVNGVNLRRLVEPQGGTSVRETLQRNVDAILAADTTGDRSVLAHVNHPNFGWGIDWKDLAHLRGERFFEVYNGHPSVRNEGDLEHPSLEQMWDRANTLRLSELGLPLLFGLATDDAHEYHDVRVGKANPGRGWVMVRSTRLEGDALVAALRRGDFYASSGVELTDFGVYGGRFSVAIAKDAETTFTTRFIGTRAIGGVLGPIGEVLHETTDNPAVYPLRGDELFVRAVVVSSRPHPNPYAEGDRETAWVQPVRPPR